VKEKSTVASTLMIILLLAISGAYVVARHVLPEAKEKTEPNVGEETSHRPSPAAGFALWLLFVLAACPWLVAAALGDPLPAGLQATHRATAGCTTPTPPTATPLMPTETAFLPTAAPPTPTPLLPTPTPTPEPAVTGVALRDLPVYTCPKRDDEFATTRTIASGQSFTILGWNESDGAQWYLIQDDGIGPQQWVTGSISVSPPNLRDYIGRTACRTVK